MPGDYLEVEQIRESLSNRREISQNGFQILTNICRLVDEAESPSTYQELILRALEHRRHFGSSEVVLNALVRQVGLFPYLNPAELCAADEIAWEFNRPANMPDDIVFHEPQSRVYRALVSGHSVVLSAPTSFGKNLVTDAAIASGRFQNVLIVVPTIALIDETRRRLSERFGDAYKIITHVSQETGTRNLFVLTQERVLERNVIDIADLVVIDEFYKLSPEREEDERCARLNEVFYRVLKARKQFYLLGPNVRGLSKSVSKDLQCDEFYEDYRTVVSEIHEVTPGKDSLATLLNLCRTLKDPTIIFCSSPASAAKVAQALTGLETSTKRSASAAADWAAANFHPDWHFVKALRSGIGIHHGRIPRALAHYVVTAFNTDQIRFLIYTSTLIEGVNTKAKNVVIFDDKINRRSIDFFTFNNIKGRSGRMGKHYIGHVYLFNPAPSDLLPLIDIPIISQPENAQPSMLLQIDEDDLTDSSRRRLESLLDQDFLDLNTLKQNAGIDPAAQIAVAKEIQSNLHRYAPILQWRQIPTFKQIYEICRLIWKPFNCAKLGAGSAVKPNQLGLKLIQLHDAPSTKFLIQRQYEFSGDADRAVGQVLDFLRLWANFHFPQILRALDRIQKHIFRKFEMADGDYSLYASKIESRFIDPALLALEEYGVPVEVARKIHAYIRPYENLDQVLSKMRRLQIERTSLSAFEKELVREAQKTL